MIATLEREKHKGFKLLGLSPYLFNIKCLFKEVWEMCQLSAIQVSLGPAPTREAKDPCLAPTSGFKKLGNDKTNWHNIGTKPDLMTSQIGLNRWKEWWPEVESNYRHTDFQSVALPTELSGRMGRGFREWIC